MRTKLGWIGIAALLAGCGAPDDGDAGASFGGDGVVSVGAADGLGVSADEAAAILRLVNTASEAELDHEVKLDRRAAQNIVAARANGPILTLDALDAVPWVGPAAFRLLRAYVVDRGLVQPAAPCLIISEYVEGSEDKNKAVEILNCGLAPLDLSDIAICMVRNDDHDCSVSTPIGERELGAGDTLVMCRQTVGQWMNPRAFIAEACEVEIGSTAIFSGDDRLVLLRDANGDGQWSVDADEVLDALGRIAYRPPANTWNNVALQRCRLEPYNGRSFYVTEEWFRRVTWSAGHQLGLPPTETTCR